VFELSITVNQIISDVFCTPRADIKEWGRIQIWYENDEGDVIFYFICLPLKSVLCIRMVYKRSWSPWRQEKSWSTCVGDLYVQKW